MPVSAVFVLLVNIVRKARQLVHNAHLRSIPFQARQVVEVIVRSEANLLLNLLITYLIKFKSSYIFIGL